MTTLALCVAVLAATVLLSAGLAKFTNQRGIEVTLQDFGVPTAWTHLLSRLVPASEIVTAMGLVFAPHSRWTQLAVISLGMTFAAAGVTALLRKQRIRCNCFGGDTEIYLGTRQILTLPLWIAAVAVLRQGLPAALPLSTAAGLIAVVGLTLVTVRAVSIKKVVAEARADRLSAQEMYVWLPRH